ncbi:MAG TPA: hypothetical protein VNK04_08765 [Gemmataceae bacterium]|nr:hypothetical protein [Gemmataceae bacterium]
MSPTPSQTTERVPRWLLIAGSVAIVFHLSAVVVRALAAPSGPWVSEMGPDTATPPQFAYTLDSLTSPYLKLIRLTDSYRFPSNRPGFSAVYLEVRLKDEAGQELATVRIPDEQANFWVRHRQTLLAHTLGNDQMVTLPPSELIPAPHQQVPQVVYWEPAANEPRHLHLARKSINEIDRNAPPPRPSDDALLLARSYARHLCRVHGAAKAEIIRHHKNPMPPAVLFWENVQAGAFDELLSFFGEFPR